MNELLIVWLSLSISGSLVVLMLFLLRPLLRLFSKRWQYYIWLLVILRLMIPFTPDISVVGSLFQQAGTHFAEQNVQTENLFEFNPLNHTITTPIPNPGIEEPLSVSFVYSFVRNHLWGMLWLTVAMFQFFRKVFGYRQFLKVVKKGNKEVVNSAILDILQKAASELGVKKKVSVCTNSFVMAPMLIGFRKPIIVLPSISINETDFLNIFRHELTHFRRKDFLYKWLVEITVCLHWFNLIVYWVRKRINQDCELSCDETVIACLTDTERQTYGETILNAIIIKNGMQSDIVPLSLNGDGRLIKERLTAIMKYKPNSKFIVFVAIVLTSMLFCGTVFAGAYTMTAVKNVNAYVNPSPIHINHKNLEPGSKISFSSQSVLSDTACKAIFTWSGSDKLTIECTSSNNVKTSYSLENGLLTTFQINTAGAYTIAVKNTGKGAIENINGFIFYEQHIANSLSADIDALAHLSSDSPQTVVYESVEMRRYTGEGGHPYIHDVMKNNTSKEIAGYQRGMLAFDEDGNPLKIDWWGVDTELDNTYFYLYEDDSTELVSGETYDVRGGWSLNFMGNDLSVAKIAYVLYCDKEISFQDGTVWKNPDFKNWRSTYEGKKIDIDILEHYYPYEHKVVF